MDPHSFPPQRNAQLARRVERWVELAIREVTSPITVVMIFLLPDHLFLFLSSVLIQWLWALPQAPWRATLQFLWSAGMWSFPAQSIFICIEPGKRSACSVAVPAPQEIQPPIYLLG